MNGEKTIYYRVTRDNFNQVTHVTARCMFIGEKSIRFTLWRQDNCIATAMLWIDNPDYIEIATDSQNAERIELIYYTAEKIEL